MNTNRQQGVGNRFRPRQPGAEPNQRKRLALVLAGLLVAAACCGCRPFDHYAHSPNEPLHPLLEPPREKTMVSLPAYQIEPPDLLQIEVLKLVPLPPYRADIYDVLQIQVVLPTLFDPLQVELAQSRQHWIDGFYLVDADGTVNLGPAYGKVKIAGMSIEQAKAAITEQVQTVVQNAEVSVQLARAAGTQPVTGIYLVCPDGTINLRQYGTVHVAGKTLLQARLAIEKHLSQYFDSPEVSVDMAGYNSKVYYIITAGAGLGDNVVRIPITGNETVLDAIGQIGGLSQLSSKEMWIARPGPPGAGCEQILPVDWVAISRGGMTATNYQLMPGDRVFIADDSLIAADNLLAKLTRPVERLFGITSLGISTVRSSQLMGRDYNRFRSGF